MNFWRALRADPEAVAYHADYPTFHHDLRARHVWLVRWGEEYSSVLSEDPEWYDPKAAGWWAWGASNWIGGQWCRRFSDSRPRVKEGGGQGVQVQRDQIPAMHAKDAGGRGVQAQRGSLPVADQRPYANHRGNGQGVQAQRRSIDDKRPYVQDRSGGRGVSASRIEVPHGANGATEVGSGERLLPWFHALAQRLSRVVVLNRSWESAVTDTLLMHTPSSKKPPVGIFMDPPYRTTHRQADLYQSDLDKQSDDTAEAAYLWAVENGETYRIAFCCHEQDFPVPDGWRSETFSFSGIARPDRRLENRDMVMFSPTCVGDRPLEGQLSMGGLT